MDRATALFNEGRFAEAKRELLVVQGTNRRGAAVPYFLGRIALADNDPDDAIRQLERAVQADDATALHHYWLGSALGEAAKRASALRVPLLARRVRTAWERAVELDPNQVDARFGLVGFYSQAPAVLGGGMDKARRQAAEIAKRSAMRGAMARGVIAQFEELPAVETAAYRQAIGLAPDSAAAYAALADALVRTGNGDTALATVDEYLRRHPEDPWAHYHSGRIAGATGRHMDQGERALNHFLASLPADAYAPTIALAHYWLGQMAERRGAREVALARYRTALTINPKSRLSKRALEALK
ncbi:MAG: tetratricopeptide repeat protein [Gemmatimonadaceae bacterium]|nr:tetratricopeptide repeat protein [Gemmatimonadaceae bacterium]